MDVEQIEKEEKMFFPLCSYLLHAKKLFCLLFRLPNAMNGLTWNVADCLHQRIDKEKAPKETEKRKIILTINNSLSQFKWHTSTSLRYTLWNRFVSMTSTKKISLDIVGYLRLALLLVFVQLIEIVVDIKILIFLFTYIDFDSRIFSAKLMGPGCLTETISLLGWIFIFWLTTLTKLRDSLSTTFLRKQRAFLDF